MRCWGFGGSGQLGYGSSSNIGDIYSPANAGDVAIILEPRRIIQVACGAAHTCALLESGKVRCWGFGLYGQLGYGNSSNVGDSSSLLPFNSGDVNVSSAVFITAGGAHTCALHDNGNVSCWGLGADGQLGYGSDEKIGADPSRLPYTAGAVRIGWEVASKCPAIPPPSSPPTESESPSATAPPLFTESMSLGIIVVIASAAFVFCLSMGVSALLFCLHRSRRARMMDPYSIHRAPSSESNSMDHARADITTESSSRSDRAAGRGALRRTLSSTHTSGALANPFQLASATHGNAPLHAEYDQLRLKPVSMSDSRSYHSRSRSCSKSPPARVHGYVVGGYESPTAVVSANPYEAAHGAFSSHSSPTLHGLRHGGYESTSDAMHHTTMRK